VRCNGVAKNVWQPFKRGAGPAEVQQNVFRVNEKSVWHFPVNCFISLMALVSHISVGESILVRAPGQTPFLSRQIASLHLRKGSVLHVSAA